MIKVIMHGNAHKRTECKSCKCEFEYDLADVVDDGWSGLEYLFCPECGEEVKVVGTSAQSVRKEDKGK